MSATPLHRGDDERAIFKRVWVDLKPLPFWRRWFCKHEMYCAQNIWGSGFDFHKCAKCGREHLTHPLDWLWA